LLVFVQYHFTFVHSDLCLVSDGSRWHDTTGGKFYCKDAAAMTYSTHVLAVAIAVAALTSINPAASDFNAGLSCIEAAAFATFANASYIYVQKAANQK
jgi:hypothetical protein